MKIVADRDIFAVERIFQPLGELVTLPGRSISRRDLADADVLLARSVLRIDRDLLAGSKVKFVGTATSGTDHVDTRWLRQAGIAFAHARGANARAVVEYCLGALARLTLDGGIDPAARRVGVIGAGAVGGRLALTLRALGYAVAVCDPPLAKAAAARTGGAPAAGREAAFDYQSMAAALDSDIVSLHVPLTHAGRYATAGMIDAAALARLRPGAALLQTSRGGVVDEAALLERLRRGPALHCVIDVWENEPAVDSALVGKASLATPHVAGYSQQAKWKAGLMLARRLAAHFHLPRSETAAAREAASSLAPRPEWAADPEGHWRIVDHCMALSDLNARFKQWAAALAPRRPDAVAREFDDLRKPRLRRAEFSAIRLRGAEGFSNRRRGWLAAAGFQLAARSASVDNRLIGANQDAVRA